MNTTTDHTRARRARADELLEALREPTYPPPSAMGPALLTICVALVTFAALILAAGS